MGRRWCYQSHVPMGKLRQLVPLVRGGTGAQKYLSPEPAPLFKDLTTLPPGELRGEVPTRVMWGVPESSSGPQALPMSRHQKGCSLRARAHCLHPSPVGPLSYGSPGPPPRAGVQQSLIHSRFHLFFNIRLSAYYVPELGTRDSLSSRAAHTALFPILVISSWVGDSGV